MAWEWSHTNEAYEAALRNLGRQQKGWLSVCWAEIAAAQATSAPDGELETGFDEEVYAQVLKSSRKLAKGDLVDMIWAFAEEYRTCDNGGFNAWMCPYGCHTVPFSDGPKAKGGRLV